MVKDTLTQIGITSTPLAHIEWSQTQHITAWNKKAELLFGYKKAQVLNQPLSVLFPRGKKETLKQLTSLTTPTEVLLENITASGTSLICEWHTLPRRDNSDGNTGLALVRDVTTLQKLDDELASLRHRHDLILENAGEGIFGLDTLGKLTFINKAAEKMFGWKRNEMIGRRMHDLTHYKKPDGKKLTYNKCPIYLSYAGGKIQQGTDEYFIRKNGELFPIEYTSIPIRENGELQGVVVTFKDITRRKENEKALQVSEEKYRSVVLALNEGVILQGADGKVQAYNTRAEEILGISSDVMSGKKPADPELYAVHENGTRVEDADNPVARTLRTGQPTRNVTMGIHRPDGSITWVNVNSQPIRYKGEKHPHAVVTSFDDITQAKLAREKLEELNLQLGRSNRELQDFASVASHDLQEPLRKIQAFGDRLRSQYAPVLSDQGNDYLNRMQNASIRMQTLINDLLTFSRVTTKAQPFKKTKLQQLLDEVLSDMEISIEQSHATIQKDVLPEIDADPLQMRQLFQNLISNAIKFRKSKQTPIIQIKKRQLNPSTISISIKDNGIGFDEKYVDRIFNIFQRLHTSHEYSGSGVGLAVCRKIVERHRGTIDVKSVVGKGSTFIITMPIEQKEVNVNG